MSDFKVHTNYLHDLLENIDNLFLDKKISEAEYIQIGLLMNILEHLIRRDGVQK
jgi:hypothetical protein